ncbi:hypothetical protein NKG05_16135 [Oerskovia sp. M15]
MNALYIGTMVVTTASLALVELLAIRDPELQRPEVRARSTPAERSSRSLCCSSLC